MMWLEDTRALVKDLTWSIALSKYLELWINETSYGGIHFTRSLTHSSTPQRPLGGNYASWDLSSSKDLSQY